jgi:hypothetical protein
MSSSRANDVRGKELIKALGYSHGKNSFLGSCSASNSARGGAVVICSFSSFSFSCSFSFLRGRCANFLDLTNEKLVKGSSFSSSFPNHLFSPLFSKLCFEAFRHGGERMRAGVNSWWDSCFFVECEICQSSLSAAISSSTTMWLFARAAKPESSGVC